MGLPHAPELAQIAADALKTTILVFDAFHDVEAKAAAGNPFAREVMESARACSCPPASTGQMPL